MLGIVFLSIASTSFATDQHLKICEHSNTGEGKCTGLLNLNDTIPVIVRNIPAGKYDLEIFSQVPRSNFDCTFYDGNLNKSLKQINVPTCIGAFSLHHKDFVKVFIENKSETPISFEVNLIKN